MRIALLSTCAVPVPPRTYGGTELVVAELAKALTMTGHEVTVFATGDSTPRAELRAHFGEAVWPPDELAELRHAAYAWRDIAWAQPAFDIVHLHQAQAVAFSLVCPVPAVLTLHHERAARLAGHYRDFHGVDFVAVSRRQAELLPEVAVQHVVHHGLDVDRYPPGAGGGGWLAYIGRLSPEKGPDVAIDVACAAGVPLRMGGRPHWADGPFYDREIEPRLGRAGRLVRAYGEVAFEPKLEILRGARATLFPIRWEEPFGLVMIESMLVGTPVIAFARGAAPEVVDEGVTGFLVRDVREMVDRAACAGAIDRGRCRERARQRWGSARMARDYERVYVQAVSRHRQRRARASAAASPGLPWPAGRGQLQEPR